MPPDAELAELLDRRDLPPAFERWRLSLAAGETWPAAAAAWRDALVLVEHGLLEVRCPAGARGSYPEGALLPLGALDAAELHNPGPGRLEILAIRRRAVASTP